MHMQVFVLLLLARVWTRLSELILPVGFFALLLSCIPQFISYISLVDKLDGNVDVSNQAILIPNAMSWLFMWLTSLIVCWGLYKKEAVRASLHSFGAVWTARDDNTGQVNYTLETVQQHVDDLTGTDQIRSMSGVNGRLVSSFRAKPLHLC